MAMKVTYTVVNGEVLSEDRGGTIRDYCPDPLGSTITLWDNTQTATDTWTYWPYGEVKSRTGTTATPFQYVGTLGYYQDSSSRNYVRARVQRSDHARWQTQDPIGFHGGDWNLYRYCANRPTVQRDTTGTVHIPLPHFDPCWLANPPGKTCSGDPASECSSFCEGNGGVAH